MSTPVKFGKLVVNFRKNPRRDNDGRVIPTAAEKKRRLVAKKRMKTASEILRIRGLVPFTKAYSKAMGEILATAKDDNKGLKKLRLKTCRNNKKKLVKCSNVNRK
jgi:hypothetical protein